MLLLAELRGEVYWDKAYPELRIRMGVGTKEMNLKHYVTYDPDIKIDINKAGDLLVSGIRDQNSGTRGRAFPMIGFASFWVHFRVKF